MERLKSFLITRLLLLLAAVMAAESVSRLLVQRFLLPYAALRVQYAGETDMHSFFSVLRVMQELGAASGAAGPWARLTVFFLLLVSVILFILPVALGVLWYAGHVVSRLDILDRQREIERAEADAQRNLLFSDFAHDLRTPIMTISGYAGALADGVVKDESQRQAYLETIRSKSEQMAGLISLLFDYTKLGSVNYHLQKEQTDLNELLRECVGEDYTDIEQAGMEFLAEIPDAPFCVQADRVQTARIFHNLIVNMIRHNPPGTSAAVSVKRLAGMELIAFADTGVRIEKSADELFMPFVKDDAARSGTSGSGLGLSIVKKITDMHGWEIGLDQPFGRYTKAFILRVPER